MKKSLNVVTWIMYFMIMSCSIAFATDIFAPPVDYGTGAYPTSITTGDFNGDGKIDLATASRGGWYNNEKSSVNVFLGNGDGTFQRQPEIDIPGSWTAANSIMSGDFNNDGKEDLAWGSGGGVSVAIGNGDGTFQSSIDTYTGSRVLCGSGGNPTLDFNGDGILDLAVGGNAVSVLIGNGDGSFQQGESYKSGSSVECVIAGNFNSDGKADLAATDGWNAAVATFIGYGDGSFQMSGDYGVGGYSRDLAIGDVNSDGIADLATANWVSNTVSVLIGNGDGTFQTRRDLAAWNKPISVAMGDFTGDGNADIVSLNWGWPFYWFDGSRVSVFISNGDGTFQSQRLYRIGFSWFDAGTTAVTTGDFNGDGKIDMAVANGNINSISIFLNIYNRPPVASAGPDQVIECAGPSGSAVTFNGSGSSDPEGYPLTYTWTWDGGSAEGVNPTVALPLGATVVTLTVSDGETTATDTVNIAVQDTGAPVTTATGGSNNWYNANVISTFSATDSCSGVKEIHYTVNSTETVIPGSSASVVITTEGTNNITYYAVDNTGNAESPKGFTVKIDKTSPTGSVIINGDAVSTTSTSVALTLSANDNQSGVSQMRFSNDGTSWSSWEPYNTSKNWTLSNTSDLMTVYVQFVDIAGNASASYSDTIYMDTDNDGIYDSVDNCPNVNNPLQEDRNGNGIGDACDGDLDGDTIVDIRDNCPATSNLDQLDSDGDGVGDVCDACISDPQNNCLNNSSFISADISQPVTVTNFADTASVTIEPGDISTDTSITVTGETSTSNFAWGSNQQVLGAIYTFTADPPSDINSPFNSTVTITLKYDQGAMPEGGRTEQNLDIYYYDTTTLTWVNQNAIQDMVNNTLTIDTSHFSSYAVITTENPISDLIAAFKGVNIQDESTWENLMNQLTRAYDEYVGGDNEDVKDDLRTFINKLESGSREKIGQEAADMLIEFAMAIMAGL